MKQEIIKSELEVNDNKIKIITIDSKEFISLTDLARYANPEEPKIPIQTWMRNKDVIAYLGLWEKLNNENFKGHEFTTFENLAGKNSFYMSPQKWIKGTNAVGLISKSGNNGGTYARSDIALEFASWLSPEFKLYVIQEFERLKRNEAYQYKMDWSVNRMLAKTNYRIHTDSNCTNALATTGGGVTSEASRWCNTKPSFDGNVIALKVGESDINARPLDYDWVLDIREQCIRKNVNFEFRQCGTYTKKDSCF